jgi:hypothetical protein
VEIGAPQMRIRARKLVVITEVNAGFFGILGKYQCDASNLAMITKFKKNLTLYSLIIP